MVAMQKFVEEVDPVFFQEWSGAKDDKKVGFTFLRLPLFWSTSLRSGKVSPPCRSSSSLANSGVEGSQKTRFGQV